MEDFVKKYEKHKWQIRGAIVFLAIAIAFCIHILLFGGENFSSYLKANIFQIEDSEIQADIFLGKTASNHDKISVVSGSTMMQVTRVNFSLLFDPSHITLTNFESDIPGAKVEILNNSEGVAQLQVSFDTPKNIEKKREVLIATIHKIVDSPAQINLISTTFIDNDDYKFELTASGTLF